MAKNSKDGFWVRFWMEAGRGHTVIDETYEYYLYKEGYTKEDKETFESDAYNWAGYDMGGFNLIRFESGFEIVDKPTIKWLHEECERLQNESDRISYLMNVIGKTILE